MFFMKRLSGVFPWGSVPVFPWKGGPVFSMGSVPVFFAEKARRCFSWRGVPMFPWKGGPVFFRGAACRCFFHGQAAIVLRQSGTFGPQKAFCAPFCVRFLL